MVQFDPLPNLVYGALWPDDDAFAGGLRRTDARGRSLVEAFTALPLSQIRTSLDQVHPRSSGDGQWHSAPKQLVDFVRVFGPVGVDWGRQLAVSRPPGARAVSMERRPSPRRSSGLNATGQAVLDRLEFNLADQGPAAGWAVRFELPMRRFATGVVERVQRAPETARRRRLANAQWSPSGQDSIQALFDIWLQLRRALELAAGLADENEDRVRDAVQPLLEGQPLHAKDPLRGIEWQTAINPAAFSEGPVYASEPKLDADWLAVGRLAMADVVTMHLEFTYPTIVVREEEVTLQWKVGSLVEAMYLQLLRHLVPRPRSAGFRRVTWCERCNGAVLATRRDEKVVNRWHTGCSNAGRVARRRKRVSRA